MSTEREQLPDALDFEQWYVTSAFDYEAAPLGSHHCSIARKAWHAALLATPKPEAAGALAGDGVTLTQAFELGWQWRGMIEFGHVFDSRDVGRTLTARIFDPLDIDLAGMSGFMSKDEGIVEAKARIRAALSAAPVAAQCAAPKHGDDAGDGMRYVLCKVGFGARYTDWLLIPHIDGQYVTVAKLEPFSMGVLRHALDK